MATAKSTAPQGLRGVGLLVLANILIPISIVVFAIGFFPYKPFLPGLAEYESLEFGQPPEAPFDKLIFMVVDALRSDFVYADGSGFHYTQNLIRTGNAIPFTANARSPTVTMPKLKSITTGSVPSFVDLILNFDEADTSSTLAAQDTWLAQLKRKDAGKLILYGDDTWLKLFPETFDRHDGTSSFFVSDFTEVDNNVTRHVPEELGNKDWGLMVLHYLGLDHIGHKSGPRSSNMKPKQEEMDGIVQQIFTAMEQNEHLQSTLFVMCGDHGMNDAGNHGASSPGETSPALVFMSPKLKSIAPKLDAPASPLNEFDFYSAVEQSDIAPTVAALLGFPVSKNNLGALIPEFLPFWPSPRDKIQILMGNARQILNIVTAVFGSELFSTDNTDVDPCSLGDSDVNNLSCAWRKISAEAQTFSKANAISEEWLKDVSDWIREAQSLMSGMASNYDMPKLVIGQVLAVLATTVVAVIIFMNKSTPSAFQSTLPLLLTGVSYGGMMFASSYVEEEQHFWYWAATIWIAYLAVRSINTRSGGNSGAIWYVFALGALRLTRGWNQTGQKYAGEPDIVKSFIVTSPQLLWSMIIAIFLIIWLRLMANLAGVPPALTVAVTSVLISSCFSFKLAFTKEDAPEIVTGFAQVLHEFLGGQSLLWRARIVFLALTAVAVIAIYRSRTMITGPTSTAAIFHDLLTLLCITQSRATNLPVFFLFHTIYKSLTVSQLNSTELATSSILLQFASFFAFGGSNAISSVDLSSAYNGISSFNVVAVGVLTLVSNWAGPLFWTSATNLILIRKYKAGDKSAFVRHATLLTGFTTLSMAFIMAACTALRTHLFIWTVFSPKYLYCMAWSLGQHLLINLGIGSLLFWLGKK